VAWRSRIVSLLRCFRRRREVEQDLDDEVRSFFEILVERGMARGLSREEAQREARLRFEGVEQVKQRVREERVGAPIDTTLQDIRYALRSLKKNPGFTLFAVLTIALGLGANTAIFSLVDGVLIKGAGYPEPERIVQLYEKPPKYQRNPISAANYIDWSRQAQSFDAMAAETGGAMSYAGSGEPRSLATQFVSSAYFNVFGVQAARGRTFAAGEDQPGSPKVVVLSHRIWINLFAGDVGIIGRSILLNGEPHTVIGVLPGASEFDRRWNDIWVPLVFAPNPARDYHYLSAYARLKQGVSIAQARAEMSAVGEHIAALYPAIKKGWSVTVDRYLDHVVGSQTRLSLKVLMWAVVAILMIACANLGNLLMARATLRGREIALRMALGARRGRVVRMLLTESLLLAACGATVGVALGFGLLKWIQSLLPPFYFPPEANIAMDGRVLLFLAVVTVLTGIAFGLAPAVQASRRAAVLALKEGGRANSASRGRANARHLFIAAQVAAAFILLVGAGLLLRSFQRLLNVDVGFDTEGVVGAGLPLKMGKNPEAGPLKLYVNQLLDEVRATPGVQAAAVASQLPLNGWGDGMPFHMADNPGKLLGSGFKIVTPGYFPALRLRLIAGRYLDDRDTENSPAVVVVSESFARDYLPGQSAIGKRILVEKIAPSRHGLGPMTSWEIVGVVADEKGNGLDQADDVGAYASFAQDPVALGLGLVARVHGESGMMIKSIERAVWRADKTQVLDNPRTMDRIKAESLANRRLPAFLLGGFAFLALLLACTGIYGVLSFVTAGRTQELGVRAALGASRADLVRLVMVGGSMPVLVGIVLGLGGAVGLTRFIRSMLFATSPLDATNLTAVGVLLLVVALAACLAPAWRAARVDPMSALRQE
jgi:putative ABC transport system permease protein